MENVKKIHTPIINSSSHFNMGGLLKRQRITPLRPARCSPGMNSRNGTRSVLFIFDVRIRARWYLYFFISSKFLLSASVKPGGNLFSTWCDGRWNGQLGAFKRRKICCFFVVDKMYIILYLFFIDLGIWCKFGGSFLV